MISIGVIRGWFEKFPT